MNARPRRRFWIEAGASALSGALFFLTLVLPDWIEAVFRVDPDRRSGALEWAVVGVLLAGTVTSSVLARRDWRAPASGLPGPT